MAFILLDSINQILSDLSLVEVDTAHLNRREPTIVQKELDRVFKYWFGIGWHFNTFENDYTPNTNKNIIIPDEVIRWSIEPLTHRYQLGTGKKLYDKNTKSFEYDDDTVLSIRTIESIQRDDCPSWFIDLVLADTAWKLRSKLGGMIEETTGYLQEQVVNAKALAIQADIEAGKINQNLNITPLNALPRSRRYLRGCLI